MVVTISKLANGYLIFREGYDEEYIATTISIPEYTVMQGGAISVVSILEKMFSTQPKVYNPEENRPVTVGT